MNVNFPKVYLKQKLPQRWLLLSSLFYYSNYYANLLPNSTKPVLGSIRTQPVPELFWKPKVKTSDSQDPTFLGGKFTTQQTKEFKSSSLVCPPTAWTLEFLSPSSGPKSIRSL